MKAGGVVLVVLGVLFLAVAGLNAPKAPNVSYLVGTFLPGLLCLILGLKYGQSNKPKPGAWDDDDAAEPAMADWDAPPDSHPTSHNRAEAFKSRANLGVGIGILLVLVGGAVAKSSDAGLMTGLLMALGGFALEIWGCVNYMRWKGHSGWFGLLGYLLLLGLLMLVCFPNRRKRLLQADESGESERQIEELRREDRKAGYRFLLTLLPVVALGIGLGIMIRSVGSGIDTAEWKQFAPPGGGFQALMPGTPQQSQNVQDTPAGRVEFYKYKVEPKGKKELFMIVSIRVPEDVGDDFGGPERMLELGRQDVLFASGGQIQSERRFISNGWPVLEMEVLPPKGAIIKARIYATKTHIYQVSVHVPKIRLASPDVQKFFDSFQLPAEPKAAPGGGR